MDLLLHKLALDHHLRGDAGVIHAGLPQHVLAAHALEAHQNVLQRVVERMAMCSEPVTFGGGMTMVKASAPSSAPAPTRNVFYKRIMFFCA
ncbi:hypothetical protein NKH33_29700 [Mesorhizobium sp. M1182]